MGDGDDYTGKPERGTSENFKTKTVKNAWQIDIYKWFGLRKPTEAEGKQLTWLRQQYLETAESILEFCPANPDRTHAIRQLKESMQTAISSIVCSDTWDDIPGPKGD